MSEYTVDIHVQHQARCVYLLSAIFFHILYHHLILLQKFPTQMSVSSSKAAEVCISWPPCRESSSTHRGCEYQCSKTHFFCPLPFDESAFQLCFPCPGRSLRRFWLGRRCFCKNRYKTLAKDKKLFAPIQIEMKSEIPIAFNAETHT